MALYEVVTERWDDYQQQRVVPTSRFMDRLNATRAGLGLPLLGAFDPLALLLWQQATQPALPSLALTCGPC